MQTHETDVYILKSPDLHKIKWILLYLLIESELLTCLSSKTAFPFSPLVSKDLISICSKSNPGTSLVVQWLGLWTSSAGGMGSIPGWGVSTPHATQSMVEKKSSPVLDAWGIEAERDVFFMQKIKSKWQAYVCPCADLCWVISSSAPVHLSKLWVWSSVKPPLGDHPLPPVYLVAVFPSDQSEATQSFDGNRSSV